jgi:heme/copper-type cytochrome/quinol oxidase subunit 4
MPYQATLNYSEPLLRQAVFAYWRRSIGVGFFVALVVITANLVVLFVQGDRSWWMGAISTLWAIAVALLPMIYFVHLRNSMQKFRAMGRPQATLLAQESCFTFSSEIGSSTLAWSAVTEVWCFPNFWLLLFSKSQFVTLPLADLPTAMREFILERIEAAGGKVSR